MNQPLVSINIFDIIKFYRTFINIILYTKTL